jgi:subtilisin family serine protease
MNPEKIHASLMETLDAGVGVRSLERQAAEPIRVIVCYRKGIVTADIAGAEARRMMPMVQAERRFSLIPAIAGTATPSQIERMSDQAEVEMIWLDEEVYAFLDVSVPKLGAPTVWASGNRGAGVRVAVVDSGIDADHPDFAGRIAGNRDMTGEGLGDRHGHGTHVAGIVAGSGAASEGLYTGVAPEAILLIAKVLRGNGTGRMSMVMAGVEWAVEQEAQVINLSLGSGGYCDGKDALSRTCGAAIAQGVVVCVAAGNTGPAAKTLGPPACAADVITVGAANDSDEVAPFSSRGPTADGRAKPDVLFPGVNIVAPRASGTALGEAVNELYTSASGTSMAAPHAAGACALLLHAKPESTPAEIKTILTRAALDLGLDATIQGAGRVDLGRAFAQTAGGETTPEPLPVTPTEPSTQPPTQPLPTSNTNAPTEAGGCLQQAVRLLGGR